MKSPRNRVSPPSRRRFRETLFDVRCSPVGQAVLGFWSFISTVVREFVHDHGILMAAAMSFSATLSLFPLLLVGISALGYFYGSDRAFQEVILWVRDYAPGPVTEAVQNALSTIVDTRKTAGFVGLAFLLWTSASVFSWMELALCITWGVPQRPFWRSKPLAFAMIVVVGACMVVLLGFAVLTLKVQGSHDRVFGYMIPHLSHAWRMMGYGVPVVMSIILFTLIYWILPNAMVHFRAALLGGVAAGILWQVALHVFRWYLARSQFDVVYGALGGAAMVVLWIYYTMLTLLLGAEVAWQADQRLHGQLGEPSETPEEKLAAPRQLPEGV